MPYICSGNSDRLAHAALDAHLHEDSGMFVMLQKATQYPRRHSVSMCYVDKVPIGASIIERHKGLVMVFVQPEYRGHTLGEQLVRMVLSISGIPKTKAYAQLGFDYVNSAKFWRKCKIYVEPTDFPMSAEEARSVMEGKSSVCTTIARKYVDSLREQGLQSHFLVDEYLITNNIAVDGYVPQTVVLEPKE